MYFKEKNWDQNTFKKCKITQMIIGYKCLLKIFTTFKKKISEI